MRAVEVEVIGGDALKGRCWWVRLLARDLLQGRAVTLSGGAHCTPVGDVGGDAGPEDGDGCPVRHRRDSLVCGFEDVQDSLLEGAGDDKSVVVEEQSVALFNSTALETIFFWILLFLMKNTRGIDACLTRK